ncbi:MAG: hypothetical protein M3Y55_11550 [Pseudomonadota bacterium]|nr:hypothetical protein [Pseudomonadota bacterium]
MSLVKIVSALVTTALIAFPALAQESSYKPGTVWNFSYIKLEPGQGERYMDFLATQWKKQNEFGKKEGYLVSYHVFSVNNSRAGEPDLILAIEYKDYFPVAEQLAQQKKFEAFLSSDTRKMEKESSERGSARKLMGGMEVQELVLK